MYRTKLLTLISQTDEYDANGFGSAGTQTRRSVYGEIKSVGVNEFYQAAQAGYAAEFKFVMYAREYNGEQYAEYLGRRCRVIRAYSVKGSEDIELTLGDKTERGAENG